MVLRVLVSLVCLVVFPITSMVSQVHAGGPPVSAVVDCAPPSCAPAPCGPPSCPPPCGPAFGPLGDCLSICQGIVATCLQCPAVIMSGILAPPRVQPQRACPPPSCQPMCPPPCPVPMCAPACPPPACGPQYYEPACPAPAPAPARVTKCKPMAYVPGATVDTYEDDAPSTTMLSSSGSKNSLSSGLVPVDYKMMCSAMIQAPFRLSSGGLVPLNQSARKVLVAGSSGPSIPPVFGAYW
jgi:hypothetical protein